MIDPRHTPFNSLPPPVNIEQLVADHKTYQPDAKLSLPPLLHDLEIDYTALSLVAPEKNEFRYKLEGYDRDWHEVGNRRQAIFGNLPPRPYRFRVAASNNSGVWNEQGAFFDFSIEPAYYQTNWFLALCVMSSLAMLAAVYSLRQRTVCGGGNSSGNSVSAWKSAWARGRGLRASCTIRCCRAFKAC